MNKLLFFTFITFIWFSSCKPKISDDLLDGNILFDPSLYNPEEFLISAKYPNPTAADLKKHILIAIHGYSATTFEWQEFVDWTDSNATYRVSQVLLDGHGRTYEDFKNAGWQDWKSAITCEYEKLVDLGYKKISLVGSSTGGALILELVSSGYFKYHNAPNHLFLIDPIVVSSVKIQSIAGIIGPMLGYVTKDLDNEETKYWYRYRPQETVRELNELMQKVRKNLEDEIILPSGTTLKTFHSKHDPTASSTSSVLIYKGTRMSNGQKTEVEIVNSNLHVFTRLSLRNEISEQDKINQRNTFEEIKNRLQ